MSMSILGQLRANERPMPDTLVQAFDRHGDGNIAAAIHQTHADSPPPQALVNLLHGLRAGFEPHRPNNRCSFPSLIGRSASGIYYRATPLDESRDSTLQRFGVGFVNANHEVENASKLFDPSTSMLPDQSLVRGNIQIYDNGAYIGDDIWLRDGSLEYVFGSDTRVSRSFAENFDPIQFAKLIFEEADLSRIHVVMNSDGNGNVRKFEYEQGYHGDSSSTLSLVLVRGGKTHITIKGKDFIALLNNPESKLAKYAAELNAAVKPEGT